MNWGIIGLGNMAKKFASCIKTLDDTKLLGISSSSFFKRKKFGYRFNVKNKYQFKNNEDIFKCNQIDNVYISTLNNSHYELILKAIESGKNILCEKPMTINYNQALKIEKKLRNSKVFFMEAIAYRSHPQIELVIKKLKDNIIGEVKEIHSTFGFDVKKVDKKDRLFNSELGGGAILDVGCYPVSMSNLIANLNNKKNEMIPRIKEVSGSFYETGVDEIAYASLNYENGITAKIGVAIKREMENQTIILGTKGKMIISNPWLPSGETFIEIYIDGKHSKFSIKSELDIFSYQILKVNKSIKENNLEAGYPSMSWKNSIDNMFILENWKRLLGAKK